MTPGASNRPSLWTSSSSSSPTTGYTYDALGRRVTQTDASPYGNTTTVTLWDGLTPVQTSTSVAGTTTLVTDVTGQLLQGNSHTSTVWDLLDRLGTVIAQVGETGLASSMNNPVQATADSQTDHTSQITQVASYSDFGTPTYSTSGWNATTGFTGEQTNPTSSTSLFYSRSYNTQTGSWLSKDIYPGSTASPATLNGYCYVQGNPVTRLDRYGFMTAMLNDGGSAYSSTQQKYAQSLSAPGRIAYADALAEHARASVTTPASTSKVTARHCVGSGRFATCVSNTSDWHDPWPMAGHDIQTWAQSDSGRDWSESLSLVGLMTPVLVSAGAAIGGPVGAGVGLAIGLLAGVGSTAIDCTAEPSSPSCIIGVIGLAAGVYGTSLFKFPRHVSLFASVGGKILTSIGIGSDVVGQADSLRDWWNRKNFGAG